MIAVAVPAPAADPHHAQPPADEEAQARRRELASLACLLRVDAALVACSVALSARRGPVQLAVVAGLAALLAVVFVCIHHAERLGTPGSLPGERRRLGVAVWALSTLMSCLEGYHVSQAGWPSALVIAAWSVCSVSVLSGFYVLVLRQDYILDGVDDRDAAAGDGKAFKTASPTDKLV